MAAGIPQEKSVELLKTYGDMLYLGMSINDIDFMRGVRELDKIGSSNSVSALGFLYAIAGKLDKSNKIFLDALSATEDSSIALNHLFMLENTLQFDVFREYIYEYASIYETKKFTKIAYSHAYRFGDREPLITFMDKHIKLLSKEEGRDMAEKHKLELISELDDAYATTGCTHEHFILLAKITSSVIKDYAATTGKIEVSKHSNGSYVIDIKNKTPSIIAEMNYSLAEKICSEDKLDDCELTARFSPERNLHTGVSYGC